MTAIPKLQLNLLKTLAGLGHNVAGEYATRAEALTLAHYAIELIDRIYDELPTKH